MTDKLGWPVKLSFVVLIVVFVPLMTFSVGTALIVDPRADARAERVRDDVLAVSADLTPSEISDIWAQYMVSVPSGEPVDAAELFFPGVDADVAVAAFDGEQLRVALATGWWLEERCVRVVLGDESPRADIQQEAC